MPPVTEAAVLDGHGDSDVAGIICKPFRDGAGIDGRERTLARRHIDAPCIVQTSITIVERDEDDIVEGFQIAEQACLYALKRR